jgi:capsular polysaccharide transport system ATP-binding protein
MISLVDVTKRYPIHGGSRVILDGINMTINKGEKVGILGRNGAGKSTTVRLLSGAERPDRGKVVRDMSISWPIAFGGGFHAFLTGYDNMRLICRIYGVRFEDKVEFVKEFTELGAYLREPLDSYSSGMSARLAFAISMIIEFDCYLIDEVTAVGDARFHKKCNHELFEKRSDRAKVIVSHDPTFIREHCDRVSVLMDGKMHHFDTVEQGVEFHLRSME